MEEVALYEAVVEKAEIVSIMLTDQVEEVGKVH